MGEPRCVVEVAGQYVLPDDVVGCDVDNTLYMAADSFEVTVSNDDLKSDWFRKKQQVKIYYGYVDPTNWGVGDLDHVFTGIIDGVQPKWSKTEGEIVQLVGRDYSAPLIDTVFSMAFANRTGSQIATILAEKYGLTPLITPTTTIMTKDVYQNKQEWDVLQTIAAREGFVCYVTKDLQLYFGPRQESDSVVVGTVSAKGIGQSGSEISFDDSSVGVINVVTVMHWHGKQLIQASAQNVALIQAMGGQVVEKIITDSKATTNALAQLFAANYLHQYSRQAVTGTITDAPGNTLYVAEKKLTITDAGRFSGLYYLEEVKHKFSKGSGFTVDLDLTNIRPDDAEQYKQDLYNKTAYSFSNRRTLAKGSL